MKRIIEIIVSFVLILIFLPFMFTVGMIIKLSSRGPIFYTGFRLGKNAKPFRYFKFRSMYVGSEKVTSFGLFIRRWHIDELPEFFLVLIGHMSLVGPRPLLRNSIKRDHKTYYASLKTKPGITGPYQINRQTEKTLEEIVCQNNWYAKHQNFWTDTKIILKTIPAIINQRAGTKKTVMIL